MKAFSNFSYLLVCFLVIASLIKILGCHYKKRQNQRGLLVYRILLAAAVAVFLLLFFWHFGFQFWK